MRMSRRRFTTLVWMMALAVPMAALSACSFTPSRRSAELHTYLLSPDLSSVSDPVAPNKKTLPVLLVTIPRTQAGFDSPRMVYLLRPHEIRYYADNQWADTPGRMLTRLLAEALEKSGAWGTVIQMPSAVRGDYRLDADDLALQQEFFSNPSRLRLTLRLQLVALPGQTVIDARQFDIMEEAPSEDAYGGVLAANRAVGRLMNEVADWAGAGLRKAPLQGR